VGEHHGLFLVLSLAVLASEAIRLVVQAPFQRSSRCGLLLRPVQRALQRSDSCGRRCSWCFSVLSRSWRRWAGIVSWSEVSLGSLKFVHTTLVLSLFFGTFYPFIAFIERSRRFNLHIYDLPCFSIQDLSEYIYFCMKILSSSRSFVKKALKAHVSCTPKPLKFNFRTF
jgi:hypothetical protein